MLQSPPSRYPCETITRSIRPIISQHTFEAVRSWRHSPELVITLAVAAITALIFTGQLPTDILTRDDIIEVASLPVISNLVTAITPERTSARLIVQSWRGNSDEPTPLGLAVQGPAEHAVVYIKGLMPGMELSSGSQVGSDAWEIPATEVGDVWIAPPQGFVGTAKLVAELRLPDSRIADRQAVYFEWELQRPTPVQHQLEERAALQSIPPEPIQPQTDRDEVVASQKPVIARGQIDGKEIAVASISPAPVQLQHNRGEAGPTEIPAATPRRLNRSEIGAMPAILLEPAELKSDRDETAPDCFAASTRCTRDCVASKTGEGPYCSRRHRSSAHCAAKSR